MKTSTLRPILTSAALVAIICMLVSGSGWAQDPQRQLAEDLEWRNIGPANMAGRVTDIEAVESDFSVVLVGAASGGVWKSTNAGTTWEPIFENYGTGNIGDIAIFQPNPDIVWVGTGESCTRNSVGWGDGVYKSTDGGATFTNVGLRDTHHIGEVLTHPSDPDTAYVAAQGHLWGHTGERGVFKTTDGGQSWSKLAGGLPEDGRTGATDLKMDPRDPDVIYAAFWQRLRQPHRFDSGGPNGGIFKTTDGGESWEQLTQGLPGGDVGKIGLAIYQTNPDIVMAIVEHGNQPQRRVGGEPNPEYDDMSDLGTGIYRSENGGRSWGFINRYNNRPFYYSHIWMNPTDDQEVFVLAGSAQVSTDGGRTFDRTLDGIAGDFHALWINPQQPDIFYVGNDKGAYVTYDHGHQFIMFDNMDLGQFYAVTADMRDPYWVYGGLQDNGNWGGPSNSRDWNGILNDHWFKFHSGDGFHTTVDPNDWRTVYTESQGGSIRRLDAVFRQVGESITPNRGNILNIEEFLPGGRVDDEAGGQGGPAGFGGGVGRLPRDSFRFNWSSPLILSPHNSNVIYFGGNHLFKSPDRGETWSIISPDLSFNDPETTDPESGGLTRDVTSAETHATLITVSESPIARGVIWTGTDDGRVHVTRDEGRHWTDVRPNFPDVSRCLWVSRVAASNFEEGTAYVSFDGHRSDNFRPWIFKTTDFGQTWTSVAGNLPADHPVYVITEDLKNPRLLFAGTEFGAFYTIDGGAHWERLMNGLPTVAVHDLVIHPRDADLIAATHGRSIWILDDITPLQQLDEEVIAAAAHLFENRLATLWRGVSRGATRGHKLFMGRNPLTIEQQAPGNSPSQLINSAAIHFWLGEQAPGQVELLITDLSREKVHTASGLSTGPGIHRYYWNIRWDPGEEQVAAYERRLQQMRERFGGEIPAGFGGMRGPEGELAGPGTYLVQLTVDGQTTTSTVTVREDPGLAEVR